MAKHDFFSSQQQSLEHRQLEVDLAQSPDILFFLTAHELLRLGLCVCKWKAPRRTPQSLSANFAHGGAEFLVFAMGTQIPVWANCKKKPTQATLTFFPPRVIKRNWRIHIAFSSRPTTTARPPHMCGTRTTSSSSSSWSREEEEKKKKRGFHPAIKFQISCKLWAICISARHSHSIATQQRVK